MNEWMNEWTSKCVGTEDSWDIFFSLTSANVARPLHYRADTSKWMNNMNVAGILVFGEMAPRKCWTAFVLVKLLVIEPDWIYTYNIL